MFLFLKGIGERDGDTHCDVINSFMVVNYYDLQSAEYIFFMSSFLGKLCPCWWWLLDSFICSHDIKRRKKSDMKCMICHGGGKCTFGLEKFLHFRFCATKIDIFFLFHLERFSAINLITHLFFAAVVESKLDERENAHVI